MMKIFHLLWEMISLELALENLPLGNFFYTFYWLVVGRLYP